LTDLGQPILETSV